MKHDRLSIFSHCLVALLMLFCAAACKTTQTGQGDSAEAGPKRAKSAPNSYWVTAEFTPFYRLGPQQATGPDLSLKKETRLTLVRRSYGYSEVLLEDGSTGWVGSDAIGTVPPEILKADMEMNSFDLTDPASRGSGRGRPKSRAIVEYYEPDLPLPPPEDLILPDADAVPVIKPEFRY